VSLRVDKIDLARLRGHGLFADYIAHPDRVRDFLPDDPRESESWRRAIEREQECHGDRSALAAALEEYNRRIGSSPETLRSIALLGDSRSMAVITGQQSGALTGPLYTIYKALTVISLCRSLAEVHGIPFVPVFWNASEDHDFEEVNHFHLVDREGSLRRIEYRPEGDIDAHSSSYIPLEGAATDLVDKLCAGTPDTEFKGALIGLLTDTLASSGSFGEWFSRIMARLFGKWGLVIVEPGEPALRALMKPIFQKELVQPLASADELRKGAERLEASGYRSPIATVPGVTNIFIYEDGRRCRLRYADSGYHVGESKRNYSADDLLDLLEREPQRFSGNVALRPVLQDCVFPTAAYVGGPGEIDYFGQLPGVYQHFGLTPPIIYPRLSLTLMEAKVAKVLDKYSLSFEQLKRGVGEVTMAHARDTLPESVTAAFANAREAIDLAFGELEQEASAIDPNLTKPAEQIRSKMGHQLSQFEEKVVRAHKKTNEVLIQQLDKASVHLFPEGQLQERVLNVFPYLIRYGPSLLPQLMEAVDVDEFVHHVVYLG